MARSKCHKKALAEKELATKRHTKHNVKNEKAPPFNFLSGVVAIALLLGALGAFLWLVSISGAGGEFTEVFFAATWTGVSGAPAWS